MPLGRFACLDLETTGMSPVHDRVTEVGIVLIDEGEVCGEWSSLVNPHCVLPPEIRALTGITQAMVDAAPDFAQLLPTIMALLAGRVVLAHNARFDQGFLKAECRRLGTRFTADMLCTVRLSRRLFPTSRSHSLDAIAQRHGLDAGNRHRALGDARLLARFLQALWREDDAAAVQQAMNHLLKPAVMPPHLDADSRALWSGLPECPGVYAFLGAGGQALYVGHSRNLRQRVRSHAWADSRIELDSRLSAEAHSLHIEPAAGEFSARLKEIQTIARLSPLHNQALRQRAALWFLRVPVCPGPVRLVCLSQQTGSSDEPSMPAYPTGSIMDAEWHGPFGSRASARAALAQAGRVQGLCDGALGLWRGPGPCFSRQVRRCEGLCVGAETPQDHHRRLREALSTWRFPAWPFAGPVEFVEHDPDSGLHETLRFHHWRVLRQGRLQPFDLHVFRLLQRHIQRTPGRFVPCPEGAIPGS